MIEGFLQKARQEADIADGPGVKMGQESETRVQKAAAGCLNRIWVAGIASQGVEGVVTRFGRAQGKRGVDIVTIRSMSRDGPRYGSLFTGEGARGSNKCRVKEGGTVGA